MAIPKVSVCIVTYNHEKYITKCLDGILMQQTTFPFEIILGEDESSDGTREICKTYAEKHPDKIKLFLRSRKDVIYINGNPTGRYNFMENLKACTGKYIALCEGDDYWTDPLKLQKQVDFLEANTEYIVCSHNAKIIDENNIILQEKKRPELKKNTEYSNLELRSGAFLLTLTMVFRNIIEEFPKSFYKIKNGDKFLISLLGQHGKGMYIENIKPAMYRIHNDGVWSKLAQNKKWVHSFNSYNTIKRYYIQKGDFKTVKELDAKLKKINKDLFKGLNSETKFKNYFKIVYYYVIHNEVLQSYSKTKKIIIMFLKYLYSKTFYKSNG